MMKLSFWLLLTSIFLLVSESLLKAQQKDSTYLRKISEPGVKFISIDGKYKVWTKKVGSGKIKLLLLHGGPGNTHEYLENFTNYLPNEGVEIYFYDQLGSYFSDQPKDSTIWQIDRFVNEIEQVRQGLQLDSLYIYGHSWGAMLGFEYTLKYASHVKGLIVSNMSYSTTNSYLERFRLYQDLAKDVPDGLKIVDLMYKGGQINDTLNLKKLKEKFQSTYLIRKYPIPDPVKRNLLHTNRTDTKYLNPTTWDFLNKLENVSVPTLLLGSKNDFIPLKDYKKMNHLIKGSKVYICPEGSHMAMWDDPEHYFPVIIKFLKNK